MKIHIYYVLLHWLLLLTTNLSVKTVVVQSSSSLWEVHHHSMPCHSPPWFSWSFTKLHILLIPKLCTNFLFLATDPQFQLEPYVYKDYILKLSVNSNPKSHAESAQNFYLCLPHQETPSPKHALTCWWGKSWLDIEFNYRKKICVHVIKRKKNLWFIEWQTCFPVTQLFTPPWSHTHSSCLLSGASPFHGVLIL